MSLLLRFIEEANAGKEDDEEKVVRGEDGEDEDEDEEEEMGWDEDVDPRLSLQFSESLPLATFPV